MCVTRYQEDLAWLQSIALHVHVMNKGDDRLYGMSNTRLPNTGHEEVRFGTDSYAQTSRTA